VRIDQLISFVRCAELGSLSAAARAEGIPKSTLSRLLHELERDLRVRLVNRSSRGIVLTDEGAIFLGHARQILDDIQAAENAVRPSGGGPGGIVRITTPYTFGVTFIAPLLPAFFRAYPAIDVQIELTSRNVDLVREGYDLAVRIGPLPASVVARRIMGNPIGLCASPDYLARHGNPARPEDLPAHPLLLIGSPRMEAALTLWHESSRCRVTVAPKLLSSDPAVILQATLAGVGIGQIPLILAGEPLARGELVQLLSEWTMPEADISLIYPGGRTLAPRIRALMEFICHGLAARDGPVGTR